MVSPRIIRNLKREFRRSALAKTGMVLVVVVLLSAILAPFIAPHNPTTQNLENAQKPPLGFSRTVETTSSQLVNGSV
jgi:peptide/nickel transport system permease protein